MGRFHSSVVRVADYWRACITTLTALTLAVSLFSASGAITALGQSGAAPATGLTGEQKKEAENGKYNLTDMHFKDGKWEFCIKRIDGVHFEALKESDIQATLNGQSIKVKPGSLRPEKDTPQHVFLMIDCSGSMVDSRVGINKLEAAKKSLKAFINSLRPGDTAVIATFADGHDIIQRATSDTKLLLDAADSITHSNSKFTHLYDAIDFALERASENNIQNLIFLSDGWEWPDVTRPHLTSPSSPLFKSYKAEREQKIIAFARSKGIRIFTIPIGVINGSGQSSVDYPSLKRISDENSKDACTHIDLQKLKEDTGLGRGSFEDLLAGELNSTLREIKKAYTYTYSLELDMPANLERKPGTLEIALIVTDGQEQLKLGATYPVYWPEGANHPQVGKVQIAAPVIVPVLIEVVSPKVLPVNRVGFYLWLVLAFFTLALIPPATDLFTASRRGLRARRSIVAVGRNSTLLSKECPSERDAYGGQFRFKEGDSIIICSACKTPHHLSCWKFSGYKCMRDGCTNEMPVSPKIMAKYGLS